MSKTNIGDMAWLDLTVPDASGLKDFYQSVVGWEVEGVSMGDYEDYSMLSPADNEPQAGICHSLGVNDDLPPVWMPYFLVADMTEATRKVEAQGGELLTEVKSMGGEDCYAVIRDPAGAVCALYYKADD